MTVMMTIMMTMMKTITITTLIIFFSPQAVAELGVNAEPKKPEKQICSCSKIGNYLSVHAMTYMTNTKPFFWNNQTFS